MLQSTILSNGNRTCRCKCCIVKQRNYFFGWFLATCHTMLSEPDAVFFWSLATMASIDGVRAKWFLFLPSVACIHPTFKLPSLIVMLTTTKTITMTAGISMLHPLFGIMNMTKEEHHAFYKTVGPASTSAHRLPCASASEAASL